MLKKGPFQDHNSCSHTECSENGPFQDPHVQTGTDIVARKGPSQVHDCSHAVCSENGPFQGHHIQRGTTVFSTTGPTNYIKLVHWNAQGAISKTSAIKTVNVQDDLDIVMIQDTRYKRRRDDLPNLRIHGYHTYHRTMDEVGHGMVPMIKHTIPSEEAAQIHLGDGTETLYLPGFGLTTNHYYYTIYTEWMDIWNPLLACLYESRLTGNSSTLHSLVPQGVLLFDISEDISPTV